MQYKWIGAILIIAGCGGFGFSLAAGYKKEEEALRQLGRVLSHMEWELQYRLTPLPELCRQAAGEARGALRDVMMYLAALMEEQSLPDVSGCMRTALRRSPDLPGSVKKILQQLGNSLGRYDLAGQLQGLKALENVCQAERKELSKNRDLRLRCYQTLGLCAGAALAILFL